MISEKELEQSLQDDKSNPNQFFQPLRKNECSTVTAEQALACVISADYPELETIFQNNPALMFTKATITIGNETIESSPLQYPIDYADSYTWKICEAICQENRDNHPEFETLFNEHKIEKPVNLQPLYDAYDSYLTLFNACRGQYLKDNIIDPRIQEAFLTVGKLQQSCMPRHLLREMCQASGHSGEYDLVLLSLEPGISVNLQVLKTISEQHQKSPIVIKQGYLMSIYGHSGNTHRWQITPFESNAFLMLKFPCDYLTPKILPADSVTQDMWEAISGYALRGFACCKGHTGPWYEKSQFSADNSPHPGKMIMQRTHTRQPDIVAFQVDDPGWGTDFVLSRGANAFCLAVHNPFGHFVCLGYRMEQDLKILKHIMAIRTTEQEQKFQYATTENSFSIS